MAFNNGANTYLPGSPVVPMTLLISNITNSSPCIVTVSTENNYVVNQCVYFSVPADYGMFQINGLTGKIIAIDETNLIFTVSIDTTQFDVFTIPSSGIYKERPATVAPAGSRNIYNNTTVPFHSLNGMVGN